MTGCSSYVNLTFVLYAVMVQEMIHHGARTIDCDYALLDLKSSMVA